MPSPNRKYTAEEYERMYARIEEEIDLEEVPDELVKAIRRGKPVFNLLKSRAKVLAGLVKMRSGKEIRGILVNKRTYLVVNKRGYIQARDYRTGRFRKAKRYLKLI